MEAPPAQPTSVAPAAPTADSPSAPPLSPEDQAALSAKHKAAFARARGAVVATGKKLAAVERPGNLAPPIEVNVLPDEGAVTVAGHGCKERLPLAPAR
jgi:hypothetical protein